MDLMAGRLIARRMSAVEIQVMQVKEAPLESYAVIGEVDGQNPEIKNAVELPLTHPDMYKDVGSKPPKGITTDGGAETGKHFLAEAVADSMSATFSVDMSKTLIVLLSVVLITARRCEGWIDELTIPRALEGDDLCRLGLFLRTEDKVAVSEIQVEDIQHVPLTTLPGGNLIRVKPRASVVLIKRSLLGSGAHRELKTDIALEFQFDRSSELEECDLIFLEKLSNGVFADPFQLQRLRQQGAFKKVHIYGDVDLERPARTSYQSIVEIHTALVENEPAMFGVLSNQFQAKVSLPLHARYPPVSGDTYYQLNITMPQVMLKCKNSEHSTTKHGQETCIHTFTHVPLETLHWFVPTGSPLYSSLIDRVTTAATLIGVVSVFLASKKSRMVNNPRRT